MRNEIISDFKEITSLRFQYGEKGSKKIQTIKIVVMLRAVAVQKENYLVL